MYTSDVMSWVDLICSRTYNTTVSVATGSITLVVTYNLQPEDEISGTKTRRTVVNILKLSVGSFLLVQSTLSVRVPNSDLYHKTADGM